MRVQVSPSVKTPQAGIEPATFRLTAESSNHWATEETYNKYIFILYIGGYNVNGRIILLQRKS